MTPQRPFEVLAVPGLPAAGLLQAAASGQPTPGPAATIPTSDCTYEGPRTFCCDGFPEDLGPGAP